MLRASTLALRGATRRHLSAMPSKTALPPLPSVSLTEILFSRVSKFGDAVALVDGPTGRTIKYSELEPLITSCAAGLAARGVKKGDVIGLLSPNSIDYPIALFGATHLGASVTTLNPLYTPFEVSRQLQDAGASQLIIATPFLEKAHAAVAEGAKLDRIYALGEAAEGTPDYSAASPTPVEAFADLLSSGAPPPTIEPFDPDTHVAVIPYSSGTSGLPKGVELTHMNVIANVLQCEVEHVNLKPADTLVGVLPFYHIYGFTVILNIALCSGARTVTMPSFDPALFLKVLKMYDVTVAHVAPPLVGFLAKHPAVDSVLPLPKLRELFSGAAPLGQELEDAARSRLGCYVRQGYGMTEAAPATHIVPYDVAIKGEVKQSVGTLVPGMECKIVDTSTGKACGINERGEICLKGPNIMKGYLNKPEANKESFDEEGFYKTGDVGYVDDAGLYYVVDRVKELIKVKGFQVPPAELEAALLGFDKIADAAVIGLPDEKLGEVPKAYVVKQAGHEDLTAKAVAEFLAGRVAEYKRIDEERVEFVEAVPKSAAGKILRKELRAMEAARAA